MPILKVKLSSCNKLPFFQASSTSMTPPSGTQCSCCKSCSKCNYSKLLDSVLEGTSVNSMEVLSETNKNLTPAQKELLLNHQHLGHISFECIQGLYQDTNVECNFNGCEKTSGACLIPKHRGAVSCDIPMCIACQAAKAKQCTAGTAHSKRDPKCQHVLSTNTLHPRE